MCRKAVCESCDKATWWGCGNHIPGVMDNIPQEQWCTCGPKIERDGMEYPPKGNSS
ncbi:hypothetical protein DM02DRAFT_175653 [Periconia macrospinosa]|uniref:Uncharacterized protein n=1 Tax=Periconia macrospinosa TaxID=97972 RepID=A0A2V1DCK6_9PLEO|nr:hypothetical protein DM02DRAFT_175653 [Periconia macrospinosa]